MHTETERPRFQFLLVMWLGEIGFPAGTMPRSLGWGNAACFASIGLCETLDQCRASERVPCVAAPALESTFRLG